ncbi:MAG: type I methionyl aminopeptidase [Propionicimonas sp.]
MRATRVELKSPEQFRSMRAAGLVVQRTLARLAAATAPGVTTADLDQVAREEIARAGAVSSFLGYDAGYGLPAYPAVTCISVNSEVVHGIPGPRVLVSGDLVSFDFGVSVAGWHGDSAVTVAVGEVASEVAQLSAVTREAMWAGVAAVRPGGRIGDVGHAIESSVRSHGALYGIVADFTGHGIGSAMHMAPDVPNRGRPGSGVGLRTGMALAVEPMLTLGRAPVATLDDEWTVVTRDGSVAAHWEHTVALTERGLWVLTAEDGGEAELTARGAPFGPLAD